MRLVGDIGGTHVRFARADQGLHDEVSWPSAAFSGVGEALRRYVRQADRAPTAIGLGVAGPVLGRRCVTTNLPWEVDADVLSAEFGVPVCLVNDFHAAARGLAALGPDDVVQLGGDRPVAGAPVALLGAGTGLGEAVVVGDTIIAGEGGHVEFGPGTAREVALAGWLIAERGRAEWEDVLSGPGLVNLARFSFAERGATVPAWLAEPGAPSRALRELPDVAAWFAELYGAEAGNCALRCLARGGVYLAGGVTPHLLDFLRREGFRRRFEAKGRLGRAIAEIPVYVVTHPDLGLLGAGRELALLEDKCAIST